MSIEANYCVLTYESKNKIIFHASGGDGLVGLLSCVDEDQVYFGGIRLQVDSFTRFYSFCRIGENVGGMKRGKVSLHKNGVLNLLEGVSGEIGWDDGEDFAVNIAQVAGEGFTF